MHCPHCSARLFIRGEFCRKCGRRLEVEKTPEKNDAASILIAIGLIIGFIIFAFFSYRKAVP